MFYQVSDVPLYTIGGRTTSITQAIALCGGENVFGDATIPAPQVSVEAVLAQPPALIVAGTGVHGARDGSTMAALAGAARGARPGLEVVDANLLHRPGPRFVDGVAQLCAAIERGAEESRLSRPRPGMPR